MGTVVGASGAESAPLPSSKIALALRVVDLAKGFLLTSQPFLGAAVGRLAVEPALLGLPLATDGERLYFDALRILKGFRLDREPPVRAYLHSLVHCIFLHPFVGSSVDRRVWDVACDAATEAVVEEVLGPATGERQEALAGLRALLDGGNLTAERAYDSLKGRVSERDLVRWGAVLQRDAHDPWYMRGLSGQGCGEARDGHGSRAASGAAITVAPGAGGRGSGGRRPFSDACDSFSSSPSPRPGRIHDTLVERWRNVARTLQVDLETFSRSQGAGLGALLGSLEEARERPLDFREFLRRFAVMGEVPRVSDDEFDYVLYTYGLSLYNDMPLIEPLEYREEERVREFVVVIDTSGSVWGQRVTDFINVVHSVLTTEAAFHRDVHIRILQCDAAVRRDDTIRSPSELKEWGRRFRPVGGGGTDFRPAFDYVQGLIDRGELTRLGGLVYFTDGWGVYPERRPPYECAFVFYDEGYRAEVVPPWAVQATLTDAGLREALRP